MRVHTFITQLRTFITREGQALKHFAHSDISWLMALTGATVVTLPLFIGVIVNALLSAMMVSMGSMVFFYFPKKRLNARLNTLIIVAFGMQLALTLGLLTPTQNHTIIPMMVLLVFMAIGLTKAYQLNPPGALYFIITGCVALILPIPLSSLPSLLGLFAVGNLWAIIAALAYSLIFLRAFDNRLPVAEPIQWQFKKPLVDAAPIAIWMGVAMTLAIVLDLQRPYWVPIGCMSILLTPSLELAWRRCWQMLVASSLGLLLVWLLFLLPISHLQMTIILWLTLIPALWLLFRHYFLAMIFVTPMTIIMVEFSLSATMPTADLIGIRWVDIVIGLGCGMLGYALLNSRSVIAYKNKFISG